MHSVRLLLGSLIALGAGATVLILAIALAIVIPAVLLVIAASAAARHNVASSSRCTLPVVVMGSASINSISRGYSYGARRPRTWV